MLRESVHMRIGTMRFISPHSFMIINYDFRKLYSDHFQNSLLNAKTCLLIHLNMMPGWEIGLCNNKPYLFIRKVNLFKERRLLAGNKTLLSGEKTLLASKKTHLSRVKSLLSGVKSLLTGEKSSLR